jgi:hypothetical protein
MGTEQGAYLDRIDGPRARALRKGSATEMLSTPPRETRRTGRQRQPAWRPECQTPQRG